MTAITVPLAGELAAIGRRRSHPRGSVLFFEGDPSRDVVLVVAGTVKLERMVGDRPVIIDLIGAGEWLGEMGVLDAAPRSATATAITPLEVSVVDASDFLALLNECPKAMRELLTVSGRRLARASRQQAEYGSVDALGRVCGRLVELAERFGLRSAEGVAIHAPLSQTDIAAWAGISRESVVKALSTLRDLGWVETQGHRITLIDPEAIRARCGGPSEPASLSRPAGRH